MNIHPFVEDPADYRSIVGSRPYIIMAALESGKKIDRKDKNWMAEKMKESSIRGNCFNDSILLLGWCFNFSNYTNTYLVKQYGTWSEYHAPDATSLRNAICGKIDKIINLTKYNNEKKKKK